jgi:hypothetical protein
MAVYRLMTTETAAIKAVVAATEAVTMAVEAIQSTMRIPLQLTLTPISFLVLVEDYLRLRMLRLQVAGCRRLRDSSDGVAHRLQRTVAAMAMAEVMVAVATAGIRKVDIKADKESTRIMVGAGDMTNVVVIKTGMEGTVVGEVGEVGTADEVVGADMIGTDPDATPGMCLICLASTLICV